MAVYFGIGGAVKTAAGWKAGVDNVVRTVDKGYCGVSGVVRQFYGPLPAISYITNQSVDFYMCTYNGSAWGSWSSTSLSTVLANGGFSKSGNTLYLQANTLYTYQAGFNLDAVLTNGQKMSLRDYLQAASATLYFPASVVYSRSGSGTWSGGCYLANTKINPNPTSLNTTYTGAVSALSTSNYLDFAVTAGARSTSYTAATVTLPNLTVNGVSVPFKFT